MHVLPYLWTLGVLSAQLPELAGAALGIPTPAATDPAATDAVDPDQAATSAALAPLSASAAGGPCASPRAAVSTWLGNLQPDTLDPAAARQCALAPPSWSAADVETALLQLKRVLDARGIYVHVDALPEDPAYLDPRTGLASVPIAPAIDALRVVRTTEGWVLPPSTLMGAQALFDETFPGQILAWVEELPGWMRAPALGVALWQVIGLLLLLVLGLGTRLAVTSLVASQLRAWMLRLGVEWGVELIHASALPLGTLALAGILALGTPLLALPLAVAQILVLGVRTLAAVSAVLWVYRAVDLLSAYLAYRAAGTATKLDDQLVPLVRRGLKVVTVVLGVIFVLQNLSVNVGSLVATLGIGSLAFALAAKDTLGNLFGSVTIFLDKPFQIGDWVVTSGVEGIIEEVGFRSTRIRTFYNSVITVPNGKFTDAVVDNYGMRKYRRCYTTLGLTYDTTPEQIEAFCDGVRGVIKAHPATRKDYYEVHFSGYGDSSLQVMLYFFFAVDSWSAELRARHEVFLDIWRLAKRLGVSFAFPTQTLHIESQAAPQAIVPPRRPGLEELREGVDAFGPGGAAVVPPGQRVHGGFYPG